MQALLSRHLATRGGSHKQLLGLGVRDSGPAAGACQADNEHWESNIKIPLHQMIFSELG